MTTPVQYRAKALRSLGELPPFSPILNKLLADLASEDVSIPKLAELIEKDTVLAANVLRLVNSALYGRRGTINSVRHAISIMGLVRLRNSAMTLSVSRIWNQARTPDTWSAPQFNLHAVATAVMADLLMQKVPVEYPEGAFIAGLLHDIGLLLIAISLPDEFTEIRRLHLKEGKTLHEAEEAVLGFTHGDLSGAALAKWNLPEPIQKAVRYHHSPEHQISDDYPLSFVVHIADNLVDCHGVPVLSGYEREPEEAAQLLELIGQQDNTGAIMEEFKEGFEPMRAFF